MNENSLLYLAEHGKVARVEEILKEGKVDLEETDEKGYTALHFAARQGHLEVVALLVAHGASINARNAEQDTPLHWAAAGGKLWVVEHLIQKGADLDAKQALGLRPLQFAEHFGQEECVAAITFWLKKLGEDTHKNKTRQCEETKGVGSDMESTASKAQLQYSVETSYA